MKLIVFFVAIFAMLSASHAQLGAETVLEGIELELAKGQLLQALAKLSAYGGPSYSVVEVTEVTRQVVAGAIYRYKTVLRDDAGKKNCNVKILNPAVGDSVITIKCVNVPPFIRHIKML